MKYSGIIFQAKHKPQSKDDLHMWSVKRENGDGLTPLVDQGEEDCLAKRILPLFFCKWKQRKRIYAAKVCFIVIVFFLNPSTLHSFNPKLLGMVCMYMACSLCLIYSLFLDIDSSISTKASTSQL